MANYTALSCVSVLSNRTWIAAISVSALMSFGAGAQEKEPGALERATAASAGTPSDGPSAKGNSSKGGDAATGIFAIPASATTYQEFMEFVQEIDSRENEELTKKEKHAHHRKVARTVVAVTEKALKLKLDQEQLGESVSLRLQAWNYLHKLGEPRADQRLAEAIQQATGDQRPLVRMIGMKHLVESGFDQWSTWNPQERKSWVGAITKYVQQEETGPFQFQLSLKVVEFLGDVEGGDVFAKFLLAKALPRFQQSSNARIVSAASKLEGTLRRLNLPGNKLLVRGEQLDGTTVDWSSYRGKVVLVDFWATWCGPCRAEVPNLLKLYDAYHEKGFDILGISLDDSPDDAEQYMQQEDIPWATLFSRDEGERGWQHPMAVYYGISGIPRAILVDRDGMVIHMNARGRVLAEELRKILGEPVASVSSHRDSLVQQVSIRPPSE